MEKSHFDKALRKVLLLTPINPHPNFFRYLWKEEYVFILLQGHPSTAGSATVSLS